MMGFLGFLVCKAKILIHNGMLVANLLRLLLYNRYNFFLIVDQEKRCSKMRLQDEMAETPDLL
jgi:hypothetical protein